jgi:hypothetical protein
MEQLHIIMCLLCVDRHHTCQGKYSIYGSSQDVRVLSRDDSSAQLNQTKNVACLNIDL